MFNVRLPFALILLSGCASHPAPVEFHYRTGTVKVYNAKITPSMVKINGHNRVITPSAPGVKFAWQN